MKDALQLSRPDTSLRPELFQRSVNGVLSALLSLRKQPSCIRYAGGSALARQVANEVSQSVGSDEIFDFRSMGRRTEGPLLLVLDRRDDPVTPLLSQWTYQAMVHELIGLDANRLKLPSGAGVKQELREVVLSSAQDDFFRQHRWANYGDLAVAVKGLLSAYSEQRKLNEDMSSIEDMQRFLERYPALKAQTHVVEKHMAVLTELTRKMEALRLLDCSELEQMIACSDDRQAHLRFLQDRLSDGGIPAGQKLRLAMLYVLRYEEHSDIRQVKQMLSDCGLPRDQINVIDALLNYAGARRRGPPADDLFGPRGVFGRMTRSIVQGLADVENVLTQHEPLLQSVLHDAAKGKLKDQAFPAVGPVGRYSGTIVFMVGGATFEEAKCVAQMNAQDPANPAVYLGGTSIHNSASFLKEVAKHF